MASKRKTPTPKPQKQSRPQKTQRVTSAEPDMGLSGNNEVEALTSGPGGEIENLIGWNFFRDPFSLAYADFDVLRVNASQ